VRFVDVQPDYTARTEVADILAALADLGTERQPVLQAADRPK
jgi:hypothetical protein